jgi:hypothetical protein
MCESSSLHGLRTRPSWRNVGDCFSCYLFLLVTLEMPCVWYNSLKECGQPSLFPWNMDEHPHNICTDQLMVMPFTDTVCDTVWPCHDLEIMGQWKHWSPVCCFHICLSRESQFGFCSWLFCKRSKFNLLSFVTGRTRWFLTSRRQRTLIFCFCDTVENTF